MGEIKPKKCKQCGKIFVPENYHIRMCSDECRTIAHKNAQDKSYKNFLEKKRKTTKEKVRIKQCPECGKEFKPRNGRQVCCDAICQRNRNNKSIQSWYQETKRERQIEIKSRAKQPKISVAEFNAQARAMGMSYGQYELYLRRKGQKNAV